MNHNTGPGYMIPTIPDICVASCARVLSPSFVHLQAFTLQHSPSIISKCKCCFKTVIVLVADTDLECVSASEPWLHDSSEGERSKN